MMGAGETFGGRLYPRRETQRVVGPSRPCSSRSQRRVGADVSGAEQLASRLHHDRKQARPPAALTVAEWAVSRLVHPLLH
jgi:hypothetical protein